NAARNRVADRVRFLHRDLLRLTPRRGGYTLVCANLIANLLLAERRRILPCVAPGGTLVLAGILGVEFDEVRKAYEAAGVGLVRSRRQGEWTSGAFRVP